MELKLFLVVILCFCYSYGQNTDGIKFESGGKPDKVLKSIYDSVSKQNIRVDDTESSGSGLEFEDDDDTDDVSGSGSGVDPSEVPVTKGKTIFTKAKTTMSPTKKDSSDTTVVVITKVSSTRPKTDDDQGEAVTPTNAPYSEDEAGVKFTIGIIVGVAVGAVLAILVIVLLVYRLRKKDEGSYSLDEQSSQAFINDDKTGQGKEYYA